MATVGKIAQNDHRKKLVDKYRVKRNDLRKLSVDLSLPLEERMIARRKLAELPRNSAEVRVRRRCRITGRPRGNFRKFELCRIKFRELAHQGEIPGVTKASW